MKCPKCEDKKTVVLDSRVTRAGREIRRRRECTKCSHRFTTYERVEERVTYIVKKDKRREPFNREKIIAGIRKACEKRNIPNERIEAAAMRVMRRIYDLNMDELKARTVGNMVMDELSHIDEVAYIRFASVYKHFEEITDFTDQVEELRKKKGRKTKPEAVSSRSRSKAGDTSTKR